MKAYKGFDKDLTCRGYQFEKDNVNTEKEANCVKNGLHCAENPLDCLTYYSDWRKSVYFIVDAAGDIDEDGTDSKISCTEMKLLKELNLEELLIQGLAYMAKYPDRKWSSVVHKEKASAYNGFAVVRGKKPRAKGKRKDILVLAKEKENSNAIEQVAIYTVGRESIGEDVWYDVYGNIVEV